MQNAVSRNEIARLNRRRGDGDFRLKILSVKKAEKHQSKGEESTSSKVFAFAAYN